MARPLRNVLRLSPLDQRIRDRRNDLFWELPGQLRLDHELTLAEAEDLAESCAKAAKIAARLLKLVKQREQSNG